MITNNKLDKAFGPVGSTSGVIIFCVGLIMMYFYFSAIIIVLIGAFVGFSSTSTLVDNKKKRVKFSNNLFGIIETGKWISIEPGMKIGVKELKYVWRSYSGGNRALDIEDNDYRIILFDSVNKEIMPVKKFKSKDSAIIELETIRSELGLE